MSGFAYAAIKPCGCMVAATVDRPEWAKSTAKDVASYLRDGLRVERLTIEEVRAKLGPCHCPVPPEGDGSK